MHLDPDLIAAYGERRLEGKDLAAVEAHLAECADCRSEASASALLIHQGRRRRRRHLISYPALAAAAVLAIVVVTDPFTRGYPNELAVRPGDDSAAEGVERLQAYLPADGVTLPAAAVRFAWQQDGPGAMYRFTLADPSGLPLWQTTTADTTLYLPADVPLTAGGRYLWYVDVLMPNARSATTGVRGFSVQR